MKRSMMALVSVVAMLLLADAVSAVTTTAWTEYGANPVYAPGKAYYPTILKEGAVYTMWSDCAIGAQVGVQMATSLDGVNWTTVGTATGLTTPKHTLVEKIGSSYRMWYWANLGYSINDIRTATSTDGLTWSGDQAITQVGHSVIYNSGSLWNRGSYGPADVIYNPAGSATIVEPVDKASVWANKFVMYYDGTTGGAESLGLAVSNDGLNWQGYNGGATAVMAGSGVAGAWDQNYVSRATIVKENDNAYDMWYSGGVTTMDAGIGYASSPDGINWTRNPNPIFSINDGVAWRANRTYTPMVIGDQMWFTGKNTSSGNYTIGYATGVPEPGTLMLLIVGGLTVLAAAWIRRQSVPKTGVSMLRTSLIATAAAAVVLSVGTAVAVELNVGAGQTYATINAAVGAAHNDDIITVHAGTYTEGQINLTQQNLLVRGAAGEAMPTLISTAGQYSNEIVINANGITVRGLEIKNQSGDRYGYGIGDGNASAAHSGWTVEDCVIHDCRSAVWNNKMSNFTFRNNEVYNNYSKGLYLEATESFVATGNFFHSHTRTSGEAMIQWYTGNSPTATGDTVISYNYINGGRSEVLLTGQGANTPSGSRTVTIAHNTLDGLQGQWGQSGDYASQLIAFWDATGATYDASKIAIRDNLLVESMWYGIYNGEGATGGLSGDLAVDHCLFYHNYSNGAWYPSNAYPEEWPGPRGQVGWTSTGDDFVFPNSSVADPFLTRSGTTAEQYYSLGLGSPALNAASDGTNIGAWQGVPIPEPGTLALLITAGLGALAFAWRRRRI